MWLQVNLANFLREQEHTADLKDEIFGVFKNNLYHCT